MNQISIAPSARRLTTSLRDIGYSFESAVADIVDNSIAAGATKIAIDIEFDGKNSSVIIKDDGDGMTAQAIDEAMRFGSRRSYADQELGRYGLGLKTASLSQCKRLSVISKSSNAPLQARILDLDFIQTVDDWVTLDHSEEEEVIALAAEHFGESGTFVIWNLSLIHI